MMVQIVFNTPPPPTEYVEELATLLADKLHEHINVLDIDNLRLIFYAATQLEFSPRIT